MRALLLFLVPVLAAGSFAYATQRDRERGRDESPRDRRPAPVIVTIRNSQYSPSSLTIQRGQTVTWRNTDNLDHTVTAADGSFSSSTLKRNGTFSHTFSKAGKFPYACRLHPRQRGLIIVE